MIDQGAWDQFQKAFIGEENVMQILYWTVLTVISTALITALITALLGVVKPIRYKQFCTVRFGFFEGMCGEVVDNRLNLMYGLSMRGKKIWFFRLMLKPHTSRLAEKLRQVKINRA